MRLQSKCGSCEAGFINNKSFVSLQQLMKLDIPSGVAVLLRHAARNPILDGENPDIAMLTEAGIQQAVDFGREISQKYTLVRVFSSPVQRCVDTGTNILLGAGIHQQVILKWWLYTPFVDLGQEARGQKDIIELNNEGFENFIPTRYLKLMGENIKVPRQKNHLIIYLTHDSSITAFTRYFMNGSHTEQAGFPGFLEGPLLYRQDSRLMLYHPG